MKEKRRKAFDDIRRVEVTCIIPSNIITLFVDIRKCYK